MSTDAAAANAAQEKSRAERRASKEARSFAIELARLFRDDKCEDVVVLDVTNLSQITDLIVIGSGSSDRQMRSTLEHVRDLGEELGFKSFRINADKASTWLIADFVDVMCHLFEPNTRAHYDLEMLWGDAQRVAWERPGQVDRNLARLQSDDQIEPS